MPMGTSRHMGVCLLRRWQWRLEFAGMRGLLWRQVSVSERDAGGLLFECKTEAELSPAHTVTTHGCMSAMAATLPAMNPTATESNAGVIGLGNRSDGRKRRKKLSRNGIGR